MRRPQVLVAFAIAVLALGACGVRTEEGVATADPEDVPFGLLEADRVPVAAPAPGTGGVVDVYLFDPDEGHVVPVIRRVQSTDLAAVVDELDAGPSATEASLGLQSALIDVEAVVGVEVDGSTAVVDLSESFTELSGGDQLTAIAQLVYTLTERVGIRQLRFSVDGEPVEVPRGDGTLTLDAVDRADYESLAPP